MAALTADRETIPREGEAFDYPVKADVEIFVGAIVAFAASVVKPGATATGLRVVGIADEYVDTTGLADGDMTVRVRRGVRRVENSSGGDEITLADVDSIAYLVDDQTVAKTDGGGTRSRAGLIVDVDDDGVWVLFGYGPAAAPGGSLLAANNLSDVGNAGSARANLGANKVVEHVTVDTLVGSNVYRVISPVAGKVTKVWSVIEGALATADATLTPKINGTNITGGGLTIAQAGSAAGDKDSATPSAANDVAVGDELSVTVGGTNSAAVKARVSFLIET